MRELKPIVASRIPDSLGTMNTVKGRLRLQGSEQRRKWLHMTSTRLEFGDAF
jgi:hypothetical protein